MVKRGPLKFIHSYEDRNGKQRVYLRRRGQPLIPLPAVDIRSPEFLSAYAKALADSENYVVSPRARSRTLVNTFDDLVVVYFASPEFAALRPNTQRARRYALGAFCRRRGSMDFRKLKAKHVSNFQTDYAGKPGAYNGAIEMLRTLMNFAVAQEYIDTNPFVGAKKLDTESDGHRAWTYDEIEQFRGKWESGTRERLAMELLYNTGQRSGDVRQMGPHTIYGDRLKFRQEKTGKTMDIPIFPELRPHLDLVPPDARYFVAKSNGDKLTDRSFSQWMSNAIDEAGLSDGCVAHGLRRSMAMRLNDAGVSLKRIAAVTGHESIRMVEHYVQNSEQPKLADAALAQLISAQGQTSKIDYPQSN